MRVVGFLVLPFLACAVGAQAEGSVGARNGRAFEEAMRIMGAVAKDYRVAIVRERRKIPRSPWRIEFGLVEAKHAVALLRYARIFDVEFRKYPRSFVKASKLRTIALVRSLSVVGQRRTAMPDYINDTLYLDIMNGGGRGAGTYLRHVLHHEYFHLLEAKWNGDIYFKDPKWKKLNERGFRYGKGGARMRGGSTAVLNHPRRGFVDRYATSSVEEDKAEVWAVMMVRSEWRRVSVWLEKDSILAKKVRFLEAFAKKHCSAVDAEFWRKLRRPKPATSNPATSNPATSNPATSNPASPKPATSKPTRKKTAPSNSAA